MGQNRDRVLEQCNPAMEFGFSIAEYKSRVREIRRHMAERNIDLLWLMAPESLYYVSGYSCEWYQAQSPKQWSAWNSTAIDRIRHLRQFREPVLQPAHVGDYLLHLHAAVQG